MAGDEIVTAIGSILERKGWDPVTIFETKQIWKEHVETLTPADRAKIEDILTPDTYEEGLHPGQ
jgi:trehalose/maltose hydrolase-like predicted phosphorylase